FKEGSYQPLEISGVFSECVTSFARQFDHRTIIVIAPRFASRVGFPPVGEKWQDTCVNVPGTISIQQGRNLFTGDEMQIENGRIELKQALRILPFAVISIA